jgi:hypothetical protein
MSLTMLGTKTFCQRTAKPINVPLLAQSGHVFLRCGMSAFGGKADIDHPQTSIQEYTS